VVVIEFQDGRIASEPVCRDQASVLVRIGMLDAGKPPVSGVETAAKMRDSQRSSNALIARAEQRARTERGARKHGKT
jgi:carboxymethylenebutenolidase